MTFHQIVGAAIIIPLVSLATITIARSLGRWMGRTLTDAVADSIRDIVSPDLRRMGDELGGSLDALRASNSREHQLVESRLSELSSRLDVQTGRIDALEATVAELAHLKEEPHG